MRRRAYPYGRYLISGGIVGDLEPKVISLIEDLGFPIIKHDSKNEGIGTLIIAVNKKVSEFMKKIRPSGRLEMMISGFGMDVPSFRETDLDSQRVGVELYLWPVSKGVLLEVFILPYIEHLNRPEIFGITQSQAEEFTDWYLCERTWEHIIPKLETEFDLKPVHMRA